MVMRIGGLASGMDIDALVEKLMTAERAPLNKLLQNKQRYEWQRDAYRDVNTKLKTFDNFISDNFVIKNLSSKTASSSNSNLVSAIATSKATGTLSIEGVSQLAEAARTTSGQIDGTGTTKMSDLVGSDTKYIEFTAPSADGSTPTSVKVAITSNMTVDSFVEKVNESNMGVSAIFENGRFSFTAKNTGKGDIAVKGIDENGANTNISKLKLQEGEGATVTEGKNAVFQVNGIATERNTNTFTLNGYNITLNKTFNGTTTNVNKYLAARTERDNAVAAYNTKNAAYETARDVYYGAGATDFPTYTNTHQAAYDALFGKPLKMVEQQTYNSIGSSVFKELTTDEINFLGNYDATGKSIDQIKNDIQSSSLDDASKAKLSGLGDKLEKVASLNTTDLNKFSDYANYSVYGKKLQDIDIDSLKGFSYDSNDDLETIHANIDAAGFSDEMKTALKSFTKDQLTNLVAMAQSPDTDTVDALNRYKGLAEEEAESDDLLAKYNKFGDKLITELVNDPTKVDGLSEEQKLLWNDLSAYHTAFNNYAEQNIQRADYIKANSEKIAAEARKSNAESAFATAKAEADAAGILESGTEDIKAGLPTNPTDPAVTLSSTTNVDDMMNKIKDFVNTYNALIKDLKEQTTQKKYRDYAPLTEEQKKDMKESEIKLWEEKAKSGLLRSDSLLRDGLSKMRSLVYETVPGLEDSKFNTLFSIGITTTKNYNDGGTLEIDEKKLREALEADPDAVARLFKNDAGKDKDVVDGKVVDTRGFLARLRGSMDEFKISIEQRAGRATMTDQQYTIGKNLIDTDKRISTWQDKLKNIEARYWKQFSAMEQAMNKANQQSGMFMQQGGGF